MVHAFCAPNETIIKANQSMRRIESFLKDLAQTFINSLIRADAENDFWAVSVHLSHIYKPGSTPPPDRV